MHLLISSNGWASVGDSNHNEANLILVFTLIEFWSVLVRFDRVSHIKYHSLFMSVSTERQDI